MIVQENSSDENNQLLEDIKTFKRVVMPMNVVKPIKRKTKLLIQEAFDADEYSISWLQDNECTTTIDTSPISNIINSLKIFFSLNQCIEFIKSCNDTRIFFISTHSNSDMIVEQIFDYSQIIAIYILHTQQELVESPPLFNPKLHGIYSNIQNLAEAVPK
ncbi:unnamed protein product [Rotaria sp. Silwood2]|nr:unnamed protein product [Rotaria sp. Silwood2]CAF4352985.1 unnamed protein product [Rotaria sp. Silwood2]